MPSRRGWQSTTAIEADVRARIVAAMREHRASTNPHEWPTVRKLSELVGFRSTSTTMYYLDRMEAAGILVRGGPKSQFCLPNDDEGVSMPNPPRTNDEVIRATIAAACIRASASLYGQNRATIPNAEDVVAYARELYAVTFKAPWWGHEAPTTGDGA